MLTVPKILSNFLRACRAFSMASTYLRSSIFILLFSLAYVNTVNAETIPSTQEWAAPFSWTMGTPNLVFRDGYTEVQQVWNSETDPKGSFNDVVQTFCLAAGLTPEDQIVAQYCNATMGATTLINPTAIKGGQCHARCRQYNVNDIPGSVVSSIGDHLEYTCPAGQNWTVSGTTCTRPNCTSNQVRNASGVCISVAEGKSTGLPEDKEVPKKKNSPLNCAGNPIKITTGEKIQKEEYYSAAGSSPLRYELTHISRKDTDKNRPEFGHGLHWISNFDRRLVADWSATTQPVVYAVRPTGQTLAFQGWNNQYYVGDRDVSLQLERGTFDGRGSTFAWRLINPAKDEIEFYNSKGRLGAILSRSGIWQGFSYDQQGRLSIASDPFRRWLVFGYDSQNRVATLTQPDQGVIRFGYDTNGRLHTVTFPDEKTRTYHYDNPAFPNNLTGITDENGDRYVTWGYDVRGRANLSEHAGGVERVKMVFSSNATTITDARGTVRTETMKTILGVPRIIGSTQPAGSGCSESARSVEYDDDGNIERLVDFNGKVTEYTYDLSRSLEESRTEAKGTAEERMIHTYWTPNWPLPSTITEPRKITTYTYSTACGYSHGHYGTLLCAKSEYPTNDLSGALGGNATPSGPARTWNYWYNYEGQLGAVDGPRTDVDDITQYTYDNTYESVGNMRTIKNPLGHITLLDDYDANGRVRTITSPNGLVTTLTYFPRGWLKSENVGDQLTTYEYDGVGQLKKVTLPDRRSYVEFTYDTAHRLTDIVDSLGNKTHYVLDKMSNREVEQVYDPGGALAKTLQRAYDPLNRLKKLTGVE